MQYSDFQNQPSSEKITLAVLMASKRLMGWEVHSGSVYKLENFTYQVIESIEDSGNDYTAVSSIGAVTASKYYLDRTAQVLYLRTTGSDNPNGRFLAATFRLFFSNVPIALPWDLDSGYEVPWEPLVKSTSQFGVSIDTIAQTSEAIEGNGILTLNNDFDFWPANFDRLVFENQKVLIYSYARELDVTEAYLIYKGAVDTQTYSKDTVVFNLKDQFAQLRAEVPLALISDLSARTGDDLANAKQRMILGKVVGNVPTNIDQVLDGYPVTGTISVGFNSINVTGTGTQFLAELSPDDQIVVNGEQFTIATVTSNTVLTLTEEYAGTIAVVNQATTVAPDQPKRTMNRIFKVAGHALREPLAILTAGININTLKVDSNRDFYPDDLIYVGSLGSGELALVDSVVGENYLHLRTSIGSVPSVGAEVRRPAIQNVRIDDVLLEYYRDYTLDASTGTLTLRTNAEANAAPIKQLASSITFTSSSRNVTGSGFKANFKPGYMVGIVGNADFFEILSVVDETNLILRTPATFSATGTCRFQSMIYDPGNSVLTCDVLGRTDDGTTDGVFLKTAPSICLALLQDAGLSSELDTDSFADAEDIVYQEIGLVVPAGYSDTDSPIYRDVMNLINKSVFGAIVQNSDFEFSYQVLRPRKLITAQKFFEFDVFNLAMTATSEYVARTAIVEWAPKEYDYLTKDQSVRTSQKSSDVAQYLIKTDVTKTFTTCLTDQSDAEVMSQRWAFLLRNSAGRVAFDTKLQAAKLQVGDIIEINHRKLFDRFGGPGKRKLVLVESVAKAGDGVKVEGADLSNTFNRVAVYNDFTNVFSAASEDERLYGGYYTDDYGLIDNDADSSGINLIW